MWELKGRQVDDKKILKKDINVKVDGYLFAANAITQKCLTVVANILHFHWFMVIFSLQMQLNRSA